MEKESFARFLDASWQAFRSQVLEAYEAGKTDKLPDLQKKVAELELQLGLARKQADSEPQPEGSSSVETRLLGSRETRESRERQVMSTFSEGLLPPLATTGSGEVTPRSTVEFNISKVNNANAGSRAASDASPSHSASEASRAASDASERRAPNIDTSISAMTSMSMEDMATGPQSPQFTAPFLGAGLKGLSAEEARAVRHRLRVRLGLISSQTLVTGKALHDAVMALGLTRYSLEDCNETVNLISDFIELTFEETEESKNFKRFSNTSQLREPPGRNLFSLHEDLAGKYGLPIWHWPKVRFRESGTLHRAASMQTFLEKQAIRNDNVVPAAALQELFFAQEWEVHRQIFENGRLLKQFKAMKEILLAGDTNRLVAELTFVRINDLAAPPEPMHPLIYIEPFVAMLIIANGIMIGIQTHDVVADWSGWAYMEMTFAGFLILEIGLRMHLLQCKRFFCGPERFWNYFDIVLATTGVVDIVAQATHLSESDIFGTSLLRFCRLIRLVRIVKVFRLKFMRDLRLMVKGLVAGIRTLALAFSLLFCVLYVISGFATMTLGTYETTKDMGLDKYFETLPITMFTCFRCFSTGECTDEDGEPLPQKLAEKYGVIFVLSYVASYMLVAMGIHNVILAVYVEITMKAAKENEAVTAEQWARESIRIARVTRELLKRFASAYRLFHDLDDLRSNLSGLDISPEGALFTDDDVHEGIAITKDLFLLVIQDRGVQLLMDDLDLPPDRANLFEIIDADGSGTLQIAELVQGLLKIRGEINKSDAVAALLVSQSVQNLVVEMKTEFSQTLAELKEAGNRNLLTLWTHIERLSSSPGTCAELPPCGGAEEIPVNTHEAKRPQLMNQA